MGTAQPAAIKLGYVEQLYTFGDRNRQPDADRARVLSIGYLALVREAHPEEGWKMESNTKAGVTVAQPKSFAERVEVAGRFCARLEPSMPVVVDDVATTTVCRSSKTRMY